MSESTHTIMLDGSEPSSATVRSVIAQAKTVAAFLAQVAKHRPSVPTEELLELSRPGLVTPEFWQNLVRTCRP
jgi:hypothetical protein